MNGTLERPRGASSRTGPTDLEVEITSLYWNSRHERSHLPILSAVPSATRVLALPVSESIPDLLAAAATGDADAVSQLYPIVYEDLRRRASRQRQALLGRATLNTTALVHESYLKLVAAPPDAVDQSHFLAIAARAMRQVLVTYAERQTAQKRGGAHADVALEDAPPVAVLEGRSAEDLLSLHGALDRLEASVGERPARVVECRFFAGLSVEETAAALDVSQPTVKRDWAAARAWLVAHLDGDVLPT
ncbi:ECF-type sigma factor [Rubrivirga sp.]|uniref:ECF-type sigma factor n=1 Tax=Rubrivirga sp. TaxID=1885344 RepID=UPI003C7952D6